MFVLLTLDVTHIACAHRSPTESREYVTTRSPSRRRRKETVLSMKRAHVLAASLGAVFLWLVSASGLFPRQRKPAMRFYA